MFSNSEKVTPAYVLARRPGPNNTKVILQRNPDGNAARSHVLLINSQLPGAQLGTGTRSSARGNAPNPVELYSDATTDAEAAVAKVVNEVAAYLKAVHPSFKSVFNDLYPLIIPVVPELADNATQADFFNARTKLHKLKDFQTKYGADFDLNLGNLKLMEESDKVNKKLKDNFKFTSWNMLHDLKLFKVYLESQQKDFTELICYLIDAAINVHQNKLGDDLILPSNLGINTDDFFSQVEFPSQAMLEISQPISDCVDAIHREAERALKSMLMHLCDKKLQIVVNSNKESSGGKMLMAFLRGYGTITMLDKTADMDRLQKLDFGTDDPQQLFHNMNNIYDRHADWQVKREEEQKMHILAKLNKPSIPGGYQNIYKDFATSLTVLDPHLSNKTLI